MRYTGFRKPATRKSKYGNKKTVVDDIAFDSKKEADYYCELKLLRKALPRCDVSYAGAFSSAWWCRL